MALCKGRRSPSQSDLSPTPPNSGPSASLLQLLTSPAHFVAYCIWSLAGDQSGHCCHHPGPPSWEGTVTTGAICPDFLVPAFLIHPNKRSLPLWAQIRGSKGFSARVAGEEGHVKRELKM